MFNQISWEKGTYHIDKQRRLMRACVSVQSLQSLRCSHKQYMELEEPSYSESHFWSYWVAAHARLKDLKPHATKVAFLMRWLILPLPILDRVSDPSGVQVQSIPINPEIKVVCLLPIARSWNTWFNISLIVLIRKLLDYHKMLKRQDNIVT